MIIMIEELFFYDFEILHCRLNIQVHAQRLFTINNRPTSTRIKMFHTFLIATIYEFINNSITSVTYCETKMMYPIAMFLNKLILGARIIVNDLMQFDDESLRCHNRSKLQSIFIILTIIIQIWISSINGLM